MITALIISLLFGSGGPGPFSDPKYMKHVREALDDKNREEIVLNISKAYKKDYKDFVKEQKRQIKKTSELFADRTTTSEAFEQFRVDWQLKNNAFNARNIQRRLEIQGLLNDGEWEAIMELYAAQEKKLEKEEDKSEEKLLKVFDKSRESIKAILVDEVKEEQVLAAIDTYQKAFTELSGFRRSEAYIEVYKDPNSTLGDLEALFEEQRALRIDVFNGFANLHTVLVAATDETNWGKAEKAINKTY